MRVQRENHCSLTCNLYSLSIVFIRILITSVHRDRWNLIYKYLLLFHLRFARYESRFLFLAINTLSRSEKEKRKSRKCATRLFLHAHFYLRAHLYFEQAASMKLISEDNHLFIIYEAIVIGYSPRGNSSERVHVRSTSILKVIFLDNEGTPDKFSFHDFEMI